ncbi:butyrate kinase [Sedimentibacter hydroxybenzoicus DSM 7310]|uniref:Probable butyrate kinase n=1 Tax=Sedimentibacter hydroxybenzoicus DSM 7310 TaxID=1123245 RepID=A0A974BJS6_SEDHY|nr:butyrate kinase [Sedimentibacter hydroxybenzoicus]NYB74479.1 butyrate kinase [Sedimentibacter hydroxybenzoicus DSM 7310]
MDNLLLIMNLGSTSTKVAIYKNKECLHQDTIRHDKDTSFRALNDIWEQYDFRKNIITDFVHQCKYKLSDFNYIISRGAPVKAMNSGTYRINEAMVNDAKSRLYGNHPCGVGCAIALDLADELNITALTVDAPCIDEFIPQSRYTGWKDVYRKSFYQALNQKAVGRKLANELNKDYNDLNAIIVHMGGGMSIAAHHKGKVEDVNNGLDGDGPMAPERAGTLPAGEVLRYAYSDKYTYEQLYRMINGKGGLFSLLGTTDCKEIEQMIADGDKNAKEIYDAMIYQIAKSIGSATITLKGEVDAIAFTGGLAYSEYIVNEISEWCSFIAPIHLFPGENEIESLAEGALLAISGELPIQNYK